MARLKDPKTLVALLVVIAFAVGSRVFFAVPLPSVQLPAESIPGLPHVHLPVLGDLYLTNTMVAALLADASLLLLGFVATRRLSLVPSGAQNALEAVIEWWHNQSVQMIGQRATRSWLPLVLTVFLLVLSANWFELIPGVDTVGVLYRSEEVAASQEAKEPLRWKVRWLGVPGRSVGVASAREEAPTAQNIENSAIATAAAEAARGWTFVPFVRAAATDLNFTLALALICFVSIEILGVRAGGLGYFRKFLSFDFSRGLFMGILGIFVGLLELISELVRVISYSFRLFGNLFAGQMLLFVVPFLIPLLGVLAYGLELFVGFIQAFVFAILTLAFMSVAVVSHHGEAPR